MSRKNRRVGFAAALVAVCASNAVAQPRTPFDEAEARPLGDREPSASTTGDGARGPSPFVHLRLSWSLSDDDLLRGGAAASRLIDFSPRRSNELFYEGLDERNTPYASFVHLSLRGRAPPYFAGFEVDAALVMRFALSGVIADDGSWASVAWYPGGVVVTGAPLLTLTVLPLRSDRLRIGSLYDLSWGGDATIGGRGSATPGARLRFAWGPASAFVGAKTARLVDEGIDEVEAVRGVLGGAAVDVYDAVLVEVAAGHFERGASPLSGTIGAPLVAYGMSSRVAVHLGMDVVRSDDLDVLDVEPMFAGLVQPQPAAFEPSIAVVGALEYTLRGSWLQSAEPGHANELVAQPAQGIALTGLVRLWYADLLVGALARDAALQMFDVPGIPPFVAFAPDDALTPELLVFGGATVHIPALWSAATVTAAAGTLATVTANFEADGGPAGVSRVALGSTGDIRFLPCARAVADSCVEPATPVAVTGARLAWQVDVSTMLRLVASTYVVVDPNFRAPADQAPRIGAGLFAQLRF